MSDSPGEMCDRVVEVWRESGAEVVPPGEGWNKEEDCNPTPAQRKSQAQRDFQTRVEALRARLRDGLRGQVHLEITQSTDRVNQAVAPYRRFVESQLQRLNDIRSELVATEDALLRLRAELERRSEA